MHGARAALRAIVLGPAPAALVPLPEWRGPAEVPRARISAVTDAKAATVRGRIRRLSGMHGPFLHGSRRGGLRPLDHPGSGPGRALAGGVRTGFPRINAGVT